MVKVYSFKTNDDTIMKGFGISHHSGMCGSVVKG